VCTCVKLSRLPQELNVYDIYIIPGLIMKIVIVLLCSIVAVHPYKAGIQIPRSFTLWSHARGSRTGNESDHILHQMEVAMHRRE